MNKIKELNPYSFIQGRDFYWNAEYFNGSLYPEFNTVTYQKNDFEMINKNILIRFGYVGCGMRFYFDTPTGVFNIVDNEYTFEYVADGIEYRLTHQDNLYNDIISCKSMVCNANWGTSESCSDVEVYHFGYKNKFNINGINFNFKPIMHIPLNSPSYFTIWLVYDKDLSGKLVVRRNGIKISETEAPLQANIGGEMTWLIQI